MIDNVLRSPRAPTSRLSKVKNLFKTKNEEYEIQPTYRAKVGIGKQDTKKQKIKNQQKVIQTTANHRSTFAAPDRKDFGQIATSKCPEVIVVNQPQTEGYQSQHDINKKHTKFKKQPVHMRARRMVQHAMEGMSEQVQKAKYYGWGKCKDFLIPYNTLDLLAPIHYQSDSERKLGSTEVEVVFLKSVSDINIEQCVDVNKVAVSSQCMQTECSQHVLIDQTEQADWIPVKEIFDKFTETAESPQPQLAIEAVSCPSNFRISETPRFRVIVEKFAKLQKDNIELRLLEEKVICIEYDVFDLMKEANSAPVQCLRAYFSLKPSRDSKEKETLPNITNSMKTKFSIKDEDLNELDMKEIEIINGATQHNKSYLEDLNKILKTKKPIPTKEGQALNADFIYEMAIKERMVVESDYAEVLLSKAELDNVKKIILANCPSTIHGFNRKIFKSEGKPKEFELGASVISRSIINELMKQLEQY